MNFGVFKAVSLAVTNLTTSPASLQSSANVVVEWNDTNTGTLPAAGSFTNMVTVTNTTTGKVLAMAGVTYDAAARGNLAAGTSAAEQYAFRLPDGNAGVGQIQITVTANVYDNVSTPQGETNNTATLTETSTLANYPELGRHCDLRTVIRRPGQQHPACPGPSPMRALMALRPITGPTRFTFLRTRCSTPVRSRF